MNKLMDLLKTAREFWDMHPNWSFIIATILVLVFISALR